MSEIQGKPQGAEQTSGATGATGATGTGQGAAGGVSGAANSSTSAGTSGGHGAGNRGMGRGPGRGGAGGNRGPGANKGGRRDNRGPGGRGPRAQKEQDEFQEKVVALNRVAKTSKGGRTFKFSALVVVGDGKGRVGCGLGKASEIPDAIRKAIESAKKNLVTVPLKETTLPHEVIGVFGSARVVIKPAKKGTGVIAGGPARAVMELAGVRDIRTKSTRSNNARNVVLATIEGLKQLRSAEQVAEIRGISVAQVFKGAS